jgi:hypothetical protein
MKIISLFLEAGPASDLVEADKEEDEGTENHDGDLGPML